MKPKTTPDWALGTGEQPTIGSTADPSRPKLPTPIGQAEIWISHILRAGVVISFAIIVIGTIVSFVHHPEYLQHRQPLQRLTQPGAAFPHTLKDVAEDAAQWSGQAIVVIGLLLLVATPVLRVAVSVVAFVLNRDRTYTIITTIVLALLILSFFLGKVEG